MRNNRGEHPGELAVRQKRNGHHQRGAIIFPSANGSLTKLNP